MNIPTYSASTVVKFAAATLGALLILRLAYNSISLWFRSRKFARLNGCKPLRHDQQTDPIFGIDAVYQTVRASRGKYLLEYLEKRLHRAGDTFASNALGETLIFTHDPQNVQAVLATQFHDFDIGELRRQVTVKLLGHGIFNADGPYWEHSRALIRPNFVRKQVADLGLIEHHVQNVIRQLPCDGETVDIQSFFFRMTLDTATHFLFGKSIDSLEPNASAESKQFSWAFDYALGTIAQKLRLGPLHSLYYDRKYSEACNFIHDYVRPIVRQAVEYRQSKNYRGNQASLVRNSAAAVEALAEARKARMAEAERRALLSFSDEKLEEENEQDERYVFLYELAKHTGNEKELRDQIINTLIAGRDTTASLMSSCLYMLSRRPDVWNKLQSEVALLNGRQPTFEEIKDMKYLRFILNETLRLFPVVPIETKFANKDTTLPRGGGPDRKSPIFIRKGQMIIWVLYSMHRRPDLWGPDAAEFRPERWEGLTPGFRFLPFNGGPRICPGQQFALTEASYTIIRLCQAFSRIEAPPEEMDRPWTESLNLTCAVAGGVQVCCYK